MTLRRTRALFCCLVLTTLGLVAGGCDLQPKTVPCSNAGDCKEVNPRFGYCTQSHCVECLEDSSCGDGNLCKSGLCERHCKTGRECPKGDACVEGLCQGS